MRLTNRTDYALRVLIFAAVEPQSLCTIERIAARNHLMKVVNRLADHGFVETVCGRDGGLTLAMPAREINIGVAVRKMARLLDLDAVA